MTSSTGPSRPRASGGFTLLELILVLVLISTVLAMAAPSLRGFAKGRQDADAAARILSLTHLARSRAASHGCVHRLNVDPEARTYWLTVQKAGAFVPIDGGHGAVFHLPEGMSVTVDVPSAAEPVGYVQFYPDGRCDMATIRLVGNQGGRYDVTSASASQRFRIVTPSEDDQL